MAEEVIQGQRYLSLTDVAKILSKNEAALRARIKRGNLSAIQRPLPSLKKGSQRFRYMIPFEEVRQELEHVVRHDPVLQHPLEEGQEPNLYQVFCEVLSRQPEGMAVSELRWHLERFYGLSLSDESLEEILVGFPEFALKNGKYALQHPIAYQVTSALRQPPIVQESYKPTADSDRNVQELVRQYEQRINALESKIEVLIQLLSVRNGK